MKWLFGLIAAILALIVADRVLISHQQNTEDFNKEFYEQKEDFAKAQKQFDALSNLQDKSDEINATVASASKASAKKVYKDDFGRRFDDFDKEFKQKWESF